MPPPVRIVLVRLDFQDVSRLQVLSLGKHPMSEDIVVQLGALHGGEIEVSQGLEDQKQDQPLDPAGTAADSAADWSGVEEPVDFLEFGKDLVDIICLPGSPVRKKTRKGKQKDKVTTANDVIDRLQQQEHNLEEPTHLPPSLRDYCGIIDDEDCEALKEYVVDQPGDVHEAQPSEPTEQPPAPDDDSDDPNTSDDDKDQFFLYLVCS